MLNKSSLILIIIILILASLLIFRRPESIVIPYDDSNEIMRIQRLQKSNDSLNGVLNEYLIKVDTIIQFKETIKKVYIEKYIHINNANIIELDSIIRSSLPGSRLH
jgi:ABC-type multidrug transport system fused ATPase/permease subunit